MIQEAPPSRSDEEDGKEETARLEEVVPQEGYFLRKWNGLTQQLKAPLLNLLVATAKTSARFPLATILVCITTSLTLSIVGILTNFSIETEGDILWVPTGSVPQQHGDWVGSEASGFPAPARTMNMILHLHGQNVLTVDGIHRMFDLIDTVRETKGYHEVCSQDPDHVNGECVIVGATAFWNNHNRTLANHITSDQEAVQILSGPTFADGETVDRVVIYGHAEPNPSQDIIDTPLDDILLTSAKSFLFSVDIPEVEDAEPFEKVVTDNLFALQEKWEKDPTIAWRFEANTQRSFDDELRRGIEKDIPLMAAAFVFMGAFCSVALAKCHRVESHSLLGVGAVVTILLSIMTGYGLLFCIGVPFTSLTQIFPYVMVGIGLDDTFILTGAFGRTDKNKDVVERVGETMEQVGISVVVSTLTTFMAFFLGCAGSLPGIRWFCVYAAPTVMIDFVYQITFFLAILAYDDRRVQANRYDCCVCFKAKQEAAYTNGEEEEEEKEALIDRVMRNYVDILLRPVSKVVVLFGFASLLGLGIYFASTQKQEFDFRTLTPPDSYVRTYFNARDTYSTSESNTLFVGGVYFRDVDVSDPAIQSAMNTFVDDLVELPYITFDPVFFWLRDLDRFVQDDSSLQNLTFYDQLDVFLETPPFDQVYRKNVIRDEKGVVTASRTFLTFDQLSAYRSQEQIDALAAVKEVAERQPINNVPPGDFPLFSWGRIYYAWELYAVIVFEILLTVILGLVSVFVITLVFVPHPFGALVVTPVVAAIYVELLGVLRIAGLYVNSVTAVGLIMSIGLVVDYNMHVVLTYFENHTAAATRNERVKQVLTTMGKSILLGGLSTFLGVLPLTLSSSEVFRTFFVTFLGIVTLGSGHGLVLTPVVLSWIGPHPSK